MPNSNELISKNNASSGSKTDANLANDSNHLGGIPAEDYATKEWVKVYHGSKENTLKEDLSKEIGDNLDEAKRYTDDSIKNQDFSNFAENTDLKALDEKLTKQQQNCETSCKENLNKVVTDVNKNFEDVGNTLSGLNKKIDDSTSGLNTKYDELFQSVSDGKRKVAEAITDKGVSTSATATFDTMASNIRSISTGGGGGGGTDPNYVDTSDATAASYDIALGKTAYVKGSKITGTHVETGLDTSDATATPYDIKAGKTAYVNGEKIEGILNVSSLGYNYNADSVEPIYGTSPKNIIEEIIFNLAATGGDAYDVAKRTLGQYMSDTGRPYGAVYFKNELLSELIITITSFVRDASDYVYQYFPRDFSLTQDLEIPLSGTNSGMIDTYYAHIEAKISKEIDGVTYLFIYVGNANGEETSVYVFEINWEDGYGEVKQKGYDIKKDTKISYTVKKYCTGHNFYYADEMLFVNPFDKNIFAIIHLSDDYYAEYDSSATVEFLKIREFVDTDLVKKKEIKSMGTSNAFSLIKFQLKDLSFLNGNRLVYKRIGTQDSIILFDENFRLTKEINLQTITGQETNNIVSYEGFYIYSIDNSTLYEISINYEANTIETISSRQLSSLLTPSNENGDTTLVNWKTNKDVSILYLTENVYKEDGTSYNRTKVYSIDFTSDQVFDLIQIFDRYNLGYFDNNRNGITDGRNILYPVYDFSQIIGLTYKGECYYKTVNKTLTALPENVEKGKRFIGRNGSPEIGTLEK